MVDVAAAWLASIHRAAMLDTFMHLCCIFPTSLKSFLFVFISFGSFLKLHSFNYETRFMYVLICIPASFFCFFHQPTCSVFEILHTTKNMPFSSSLDLLTRFLIPSSDMLKGFFWCLYSEPRLFLWDLSAETYCDIIEKRKKFYVVTFLRSAHLKYLHFFSFFAKMQSSKWLPIKCSKSKF